MDQDQKSFLLKRKHELLAKKEGNKTATLSFANDGSFLEKFKAMQNTGRVNEKKIKLEPLVTDIPGKSSYDLARELAEKVAKEGVQVEMMARIQGRKNPQYQFLFESSDPVSAYYQEQLEIFKNQNTISSTSSSISKSTTEPKPAKRRWDQEGSSTSTSITVANIKQKPLDRQDKQTEAIKTEQAQWNQPSAPVSTLSVKEEPKPPSDFMTEFEKAKELVRAKAQAMMTGGIGAVAKVKTEEEIRREKEIEEQKAMNDIYMRVIQQQMASVQQMKQKKKRDPNKPKYEYDSDEDIEGGTWEHKKRQEEMQKTAAKALELTDNAKGKHHLADFLPPDELEKFLEKVKAVKEGREADFSDYAKYKITENNIGFKMLAKAGWKEGKGLGANEEGITTPINKGKTSFDQAGLGTEKVSEVKKDDDDFDLYRKRMMLAYKFRPNPLNNPRRPYYS